METTYMNGLEAIPHLSMIGPQNLGVYSWFSTKNNSHSDIAISRMAKVQFKVGYTANESQINCQNVELYKTQ